MLSWHMLLIFPHLQGWSFYTEPPFPKVPHFWQDIQGDCVPRQAPSDPGGNQDYSTQMVLSLRPLDMNCTVCKCVFV